VTNFYNAVIPRPAGVPATVEVRVVAGRVDGENLTPEELAALRAAYPRLEATAQTPPKPAVKAKAPVSTKARKAPAKRAAAKRP